MDFRQEISKNRQLIMGLSILSIMLFHQGWIAGKWIFPFNIIHLFGNFGVDIFFFVSGFGLVFSLSKINSTLSFYRRRLFRLLPLCIFCGVCKYLFDYYYPSHIKGINTNWTTLLGLDMWFIRVLLTYYLITPFLFKFLKNHKFLFILSTLVAPLCGELLLGNGVQTQYFARFFSFTLGMFIAYYNINLNKKLLLCSFTLFFISHFIKLYITRIHSFSDFYIYYVFSAGIIWFLFVSIKIINKYLQNDNIIKNTLCFLGKHSLEIYLIHEFVYKTLYHLNGRTYLPGVGVPFIDAFIQLMIGLLLSVFIAYLCFFIVNYITIKMKLNYG